MKLIPLSPPQQKQVLPYLSTLLHQNFDNCAAPTIFFFLEKKLVPPFKKWGGVQKLWFVSVPLVHVEYSIAFVSSVLVWY